MSLLWRAKSLGKTFQKKNEMKNEIFIKRLAIQIKV